MGFIRRKIEERFKKALDRKKSILLLGPRQTGKTTLVKNLKADLYINLAKPTTRQLYEKDPGRFTREIEAMTTKFPLIIVDEIQKVMPLLDAIQDLIDSEVAQFILNDLDMAISTPLGSLGGGADFGRITKDAALALKARVALFEGTWSKYHVTGGDSNAYFSQSLLPKFN